MMSLSKFKALVVITVVFLLGAVVGASLGRAVLSPLAAKESHRHSRVRFIEKLQSRLNLSDEQTLRVQAILDDARQQFGTLHESVKPQFETIRRQMRERIHQQLGPDQTQEFAAMCAEYDQRRAEHGKKHR
jgi:Spy/CpxP family protein refolding chaperone